jgi:hypothetical protein
MAVYRVGSNKSSINNFPSVRPTLDLDFANTKTLDPRITFTRGSGGSYVSADGLIKYAGVNEARFDHDPVTGESLGLLVEESRTNIMLNSSDTSLWPIRPNMIPSGNPIVLPDGYISTTVEYRGETTEPNSKFLRPNPSGAIIAGETWTFSVFLRAGTERTVNVALSNSTVTEGVRVNTFNLITGEYSSIIESDVTNGRFGVIPYPNGWWRVWISCTFTNSASEFQIVIRLLGFSNTVTRTTSFSAWGSQLERGSFPTSYIPTQASSRTRAADTAQITGKNFSSWYNPNEGSLYFNGNYNNPDFGTSNTRGFLTINNSTTNTRIDFRQRLSTSILSSNGVNVNWVSVNNPVSLTDIQDARFQKSAISYSVSAHSQASNGYLIRSSSTKLDPLNATRLGLFIRDGQSDPVNGQGGHIKSIKYYPKKLNDNELTNLTR